MKTDAQCSQLPAKGSFFSDLCFRSYKLRRFRKYCQKTVIKLSSPKCQIPSRFRATTIGAETKVKKRDKSLLSSSTSGTTDMDNTVIQRKKEKKKKRSCHKVIPMSVSSQFHQHKSHFPAQNPAVPLITTFRLALFQLFKRPGGQPLLNSPNRGRLTRGCRLQAAAEPQGEWQTALGGGIPASIGENEANRQKERQKQTAKGLLDWRGERQHALHQHCFSK